jgi:hypothetical protein
MGAYMKTTIELNEELFLAAKHRARATRTTLKALIEEGLRSVLEKPEQAKSSGFVLQDARVHGQVMLLPDPRDWQALEDEHLGAASGLSRT